MREYDYHYRKARDDLDLYRAYAASYRAKWLFLRQALRAYSQDTGHEFPDHIKKAIGIKND